MRFWITAVLFVAVLLASASAGAQPPSSLDPFDWLLGSWQREVRGGVAIESWTRVSEDTLEGVVTITRGEEKRTTEYLRLERFGERVYYTALPLENERPTPFALVESTEDRWVFENLDHDFPQRIIYMRRDPEHMTVRIESAHEASDSGVDFEFTRSADAQRP